MCHLAESDVEILDSVNIFSVAHITLENSGASASGGND
jgi:hypothetical protein